MDKQICIYKMCFKDLVRLVKIVYIGRTWNPWSLRVNIAFPMIWSKLLLVTIYVSLSCSILRSLNQESLHQGQRILFMVQINGKCNFTAFPIHYYTRCTWILLHIVLIWKTMNGARLWWTLWYRPKDPYSFEPVVREYITVMKGILFTHVFKNKFGCCRWWSDGMFFSILQYSSCASSRVTLIY